MSRDRPTSWKAKVTKQLLELAEIFKEYVRVSEQMKNMTPQEREKFRGVEPNEETKNRVREKMSHLASGQSKDEATSSEPFYAASISATEGQPIAFGDHEVVYDAVPNEPPGNKWLLRMMEFIAERRYARPLYQILEEDRMGVKESSDKIQRIMQDAHQLRYGQPVLAPKGKVGHRAIFDFGMGRGLENLTAEELAEFFDNFCPFCANGHSPDALRRQRDRLTDQRNAALDWSPDQVNPTKRNPR
jgi:hypothetical protein